MTADTSTGQLTELHDSWYNHRTVDRATRQLTQPQDSWQSYMTAVIVIGQLTELHDSWHSHRTVGSDIYDSWHIDRIVDSFVTADTPSEQQRAHLLDNSHICRAADTPVGQLTHLQGSWHIYRTDGALDGQTHRTDNPFTKQTARPETDHTPTEKLKPRPNS